MESIDRLREWWRDRFPVMDKQLGSEFREHADAIEYEVEAACAEAYGNGVQSVALPDMTAYVKLPIDADGKPIHIGDVMESDGGEAFRVCRLQLFDSGWAIDGGKFTQNEIRHHHAPTVEDVLREFAAEVETAGGVMELPDATLAEYAAKLRLAGDE